MALPVSAQSIVVILPWLVIGGAERLLSSILRHLKARGIGTVIVTTGGRGALLVEAGSVRRIAPVKVTPVDTTGTGDAVIGALAHFRVSGRLVYDALCDAALYAADAITRRRTQKSYGDAQSFEALRARLAP